jgi:uncharacterized protein (DUF1778 family)
MEKRARGRPSGGGSKLQRTETVTIRLDPKLRYLTELAARKQRRTVSSFIEWAIERALGDIILREHVRGSDALDVTLSEEAEKLWDIDEADRIAKLGLYYPELLTHDEQVLWKLVQESACFWQQHKTEEGNTRWTIAPEELYFQTVRKYWETLKQIASGERDRASLPEW